MFQPVVKALLLHHLIHLVYQILQSRKRVSEIRKYGESLVIVDQIPNKLTPEVLKNTNTKIIHDQRFFRSAAYLFKLQHHPPAQKLLKIQKSLRLI